MDRISIFNYEAFYLDYLEGNLSEEDTALLMEFFAANPDLRMDDEELPSYSSADQVVLDAQWKNSLKQSSDEEVITTLNVDQFLIAEAEGILSKEKVQELNAFIDANPEFALDRKIYALTNFEPDMSVAYTDKASLKKEKARVVWFYYAAAAAASVILFLWVWNSTQGISELNDNTVIHANDKLNEKTLQDQDNGGETNEFNKLNTVNSEREFSLANNDQQTNNEKEPANTTNTSPNKKNEKIDVNGLSHHDVSPLIVSVDPKNLEPITPTIYEVKQNSNPQDVYASAREIKMSNPIEPITKFVSEKTNTAVDFQKTDKGSDQKGFYLKIGKFEFSRKKH